MDTLETVIGRKSRHFVRIFVSQFGFTEKQAIRFVELAGSDLVESHRWLAGRLGPGRLSAPENVRDLLSAIHADGIASSLGMSSAEVWSGLRVFVPHVLQLADRQPTGFTSPRDPLGRASRQRPVA